MIATEFGDLLNFGAGDDTVGAGSDTVISGAGKQQIFGHDGSDPVLAGKARGGSSK